jgi:hypothetical protein
LVCVSDFFSSFVALDELLLDGEELLVSLEPEVEPLPAEPFVLLEALLGLDEAPPPDGLFWSVLDDELDEGEELGGVALEELEAPEGDDGVVAPLDEDELDGGVDGVVVLEDDEPVAALSLPARSHAVSRLAPSATETAMARVDNLMGPPWLGLLVG